MPDNMDLNYPKHKHPHGIENAKPNEYRVWICDDCLHTFIEDEVRKFDSPDWGHPCKSHPCRKGQRCEGHLEPYLPELGEAKNG